MRERKVEGTKEMVALLTCIMMSGKIQLDLDAERRLGERIVKKPNQLT